MITETEMRAKLRDACDAAGSVHAWSRANCMNQSNTNKVLQGKLAFPKSIAKLLGYERKVHFVPCNREKGSA